MSIKNRIGREWVDGVARVGEEVAYISKPFFVAYQAAPDEIRALAWQTYLAARAVQDREFYQRRAKVDKLFHAKLAAFTSGDIDGEFIGTGTG